MSKKTVNLLIIVSLVAVGIGATCWCKLSTFLEETKSHKTLSGTVEQSDLGDEPAPDIRINLWGPQRVNPGQKINYIIEYRNDRLKASGEITLFVSLDYSLKYISASPGAFYNGSLYTVDWGLGNMPAKSSGYLSIQVEVAEELAQGTILETDAIINEWDEKKGSYVKEKVEGNMSSSVVHTITTVRDPNEKIVSPKGDIRPGDRLNYTINYENERDVTTQDVYITDTLDEDLDVSTLTINDNGTYDSNTRTIRWSIGEVGPHQKGSVTFSVNVKQDASQDNGEIINFATVHFPSVHEATRTNGTVTLLPDTTPPVSKASMSPVSNQDGWYNTDVTITLTAEDGSGVKEMHYILTGAEIMEDVVPDNTAQIFISTDGISNLTYWAVDNVGNIEDSKSLEVKLKYKKTIEDEYQKSIFPPPQEFTNSIGMKFVLIKAGEFMMGSPSDEEGRNEYKDQHKVTLTKDFYLQTTEVTQRQYEEIMGTNPGKSNLKGRNLPVEAVSWYEAIEFCKRLSEKDGKEYRLPTEAEWEYACRAGTTTRYFFGDDEERLEDYAWYRDNSGKRAHEVGEKRPNVWGLYDMHGNVSEWCSDWYVGYPRVNVTNPIRRGSGSKVIRGGSWGNTPSDLRCDRRGHASARLFSLGFRCASTASSSF